MKLNKAYIHGRQPQWKTSLMEDDLNGRQPQRRPQLKMTTFEDNLK